MFLMGAATFFKPAKPLETKPPPVTLKPKAPLTLLELEVPPFVLELGGPLTAIGSEVPGAVFNPDAIRVSWVATAEAITRGIVFLLSLKDFSDAMLASNAHFTPIFPGSTRFFSRAFGRFGTVFPAESAFLLFKTSAETGVRRGP
jgi:hypothetical protein